MWLCINDAFLSIVHKDCARDELLVRARRKGDIEKIFPGAKVIQSRVTDYRYRAAVKRKEVGEAVAAETSRITYSNFKDSVTDKKLHDAYLRVWSVMADLQARQAPRPMGNQQMNGKPQRYAIVGMKNYKGERFVESLAPDTPVVLVREPSNPWDQNAIAVWARAVADDPQSLVHVGYIPKTQNAVLARFIDAQGKPWTAPSPVMALDAPAPTSIQVFRAVDARLHKGSNVYPLVEVV